MERRRYKYIWSYGSGMGDFNTVLATFPESYRAGLTALHKAHPNWQFEKYDTGLDWSNFIKAQDKGDLNLVDKNCRPSSWIQKDPGYYPGSDNYQPGWGCASTQVIEYFADPRNFLTEKGIFQFEKLSYDPHIHTKEGVKAILADTFMGNDTYVQYFMDAAKEANVSPYFLASKARLEMGDGTKKSPLADGKVSGYEGIYNYYNIGAFPQNGRSANVNGAIFAKSYDPVWNSPRTAIVEGAKYIAKKYISKGQDTMYGQKFDMVGDLYSNQFVQNIEAANTEGEGYYDGYKKIGCLESQFVFKIPVFQGSSPKPVSLP